MATSPSIFLSHGAPTILTEPSPARQFLTQLGSQIPRPRAVLCVTAHWLTSTPTLSADPRPETLYDFGGFPKNLYTLTYPAPGAPDVAEQAARALRAQNIPVEITARRGFDHGTWVPLKLIYPEADIQVAQLSVQPHRSAAWHYQLGQALSGLLDDNVLILGSGALTHNLDAWMQGDYASPPGWVTDFTDWVFRAITTGRIEDLVAYAEKAPHAPDNHPTPEHFLPLFVALGAAGPDATRTRLHTSIADAVLSMDAYQFAP